MANVQPTTNGPDAVNAPEIDTKDIGYLFAQDYYTYLNKDPSQLHCFYSKASSCIHGTEGEVVEKAHGQSEIHQVVMKHGFKDCKVHVTNIDILPSLANSIIVQVMGEMSNNNKPSRRFVQTFFLAEQPGGYYVHNDVMRFLRDDEAEGETAQAEEEVEEEVEDTEAPLAEEAEPAAEVITVEPEEEGEVADDGAGEAATEPQKAAESVAEPEPAKLSKDQDQPAVAPAAEGEKEVATPSAISVPAEPAPAVAEQLADAGEAPAQPEQKQEQQPVATAEPSSTQAQQETSTEPPKPKSWANLAANNREKWGAAVAKVEGTVASVTPSANASSHTSRGSTPVPSDTRPAAGAASSKVVTVTELNGLDRNHLTEFVEKKYGPVTIRDLRRNHCQLVFKDETAVKKALSDKVATIGDRKIRFEAFVPGARREDTRGSRGGAKSGSGGGFRAAPGDGDSTGSGRRGSRRGERAGSHGGRFRGGRTDTKQ